MEHTKKCNCYAQCGAAIRIKDSCPWIKPHTCNGEHDGHYCKRVNLTVKCFEIITKKEG